MLEQRVSAAAIDLDLAKHGKTDAVVQLAEFRDLVICTWILLAELVAGKTQYFQALLPVFLVQFFQPGELGRKTALGGGVDHQ